MTLAPAPPNPPRPAAAINADRRWLNGLRRRYHHQRFVAPDPLQFLYEYEDLGDREIVGLVASSLAYGNVKAMLPAIASVLAPLGDAPARVLARTSPRELRRRYAGFRYRFTSAAQLTGLLIAARRVMRDHGSLDECIADADPRSNPDALTGLGTLVDALAAAAPGPLPHLLPHPRDGSACKRLNLFLRWMVRKDAIDPGGWRSIRPEQLVMPLDTHVFRTATAREWTTRRTPDLKTALAVTAVLREISPADPLRYDFAMTRPGIRGEAT